MTAAVYFQGAALDEGLAAVLADMWPLATVNLLVAPECSGSGEAFGTDAAAVRFDAGVTAHVRLHVLELLPTDAAGATGLTVRLQVSQQSIRGVELVAADTADVGGVPAVRLSVFPQEATAVEGITADSAAEGGGCLARDMSSISLWFQRLRPAVIAAVILLHLSPDRPQVQRLRPAVDFLVAPQCSGPRETFATDVAVERFDAGVAPHVRLHVLKRFPADVTGAAGFSVRPEVV